MINIDKIKKFINGTLTNEEVSSLLQNPDFMSDVLIYTKDVKYYDICNRSIKTDYNFAKKILKSGIFTIDFYHEVLNEFCFSTSMLIEKIDLTINYIDTLGDLEDAVYSNILDNFYNQIMMRDNFESKKVKDDSETNFKKIYRDFYSHRDVIDYFAKRIANDYFLSNVDNFDDLENAVLKNRNDCEKARYLILKKIKDYDINLAGYLQHNHALFEKVVEDLVIILNEWKDSFDIIIEDNILTEVRNYVKYVKNNSFTEDELLGYLSSSLNNKYLNSSENSNVEIQKLTLMEQRNLIKLRNKIIDICNFGDLTNYIDDDFEKVKKRTKKNN